MQIKINIKKLGVALSLIIIIYQTVTSMIWQYEANSQSSMLSILMLFVSLISVLITFGKPIPTRSIIFLLLLYYLYIVSISLLNGYLSIFLGEPTLIITMAFWIIIFWVFYEAAFTHEIDMQIISNIVSVLLILCFFLFIRYYLANLFRGYLTGLNIVYYLIFMLPIVFANKNQKMVTIGLVICTVATLLSGKRGALIAIIFAWVVRTQDTLKDLPLRKRIQRIILISGWCIIAYLLIQIFVSRLNLNILSRMNSLINGDDESGSGRTKIWTQYFEIINNSNILQNLFGRGYVAAKRNPKFIMYGLKWAHNDFLQILFDYGFIGIVMFLAIIKKLFVFSMIMKKADFHEYQAFYLSLLIFLICCMFSMITVYPQWFLVMAAFWGLCIGKYEKSNL